MKKLLVMLTVLAIMLSTCIVGIGATAYAEEYEASPESDFIAFDGVIEEYIGPGGDVVIPSEIEGVQTVEIAQDAFLNNSDITGVVIPEGVEKLGHRAFKACINLVKVELPYSLYELGAEVFQGTGITEILIPGNLTKIAYNTFGGCKGLKNIKISNGVKEIHSNAFGGTSFGRIIFPESVEFIAGYAMNYVVTNSRIEIIICNPDLDLGKTVVQGGLWEDMMKGNWTSTIARPWNSSTSHDQVFNVVVPKDSSIAEFVSNWRTNGLLEEGESGACNNSYNVQQKGEDYFEKIAEEVAEYSVEEAREDLSYGAGSSSDSNSDEKDNDSDDDSNSDDKKGSSNSDKKNNKNDKNGSTTTIIENDNDSSMWIILAVVGGVFLLLIIGVVVFAVIFLNKPKKAPQAVSNVSEVEELKARLAALEGTPAPEATEEVPTEETSEE